jgi:hypothetical protein
MRIGNTDGGVARLRTIPARSGLVTASVAPGTRVQALGTAERHEDLHWQLIRTPAGAEGWIPIDFLVPE